MAIQSTKPPLLIDAFQSGNQVLAILTGRLVLENCEAARNRLSQLLNENVEKLYLYLGRLDFVDSAGWGAMVGLKMAANRNRTRLVFLSPTQRILEIFRISKLDSIFEIVQGSEAETIRAQLVKKENIIWRESADENLERSATEMATGPVNPPGGNEWNQGPLPEPAAASLKTDPQREVERLSRDALEQLRNGAYQRAIDLYRRVLEIDPDNVTTLNNLGVVYERKPDWYPEAIRTWKKVLELSEKRHDFKHADRAKRHLQFLERMT